MGNPLGSFPRELANEDKSHWKDSCWFVGTVGQIWNVTIGIRAILSQYGVVRGRTKDMNDYLFLMRDAVDEYKMAIEKVDPNFDCDYYDNLIFGEPLTPAPEDPVRFKQLNPIGTPRAIAEQENAPAAESATSALAEQVEEKAHDQPAQQSADQPLVPPTSS